MASLGRFATLYAFSTPRHVPIFMADPGDFSAEWTFSLSDGHHRVQFRHGTTSGKRVVVVDGEVIVRKNWMFQLVGKERFDVSGTKACIHIDPKGMSYEYWLEIGGKSLEKFIEQRRKSCKTWIPTVKGNYHRVVLEKDTMDVYVDGEKVETAGEFVDDGTETHFTVDGVACYIAAVSSGNRREGIVHSLIVNEQEVAEVEE